MAISAPHYHCLKELHRRGELPQGGRLLEIGEANWYGDIPQSAIAADARNLSIDIDPAPDLLADLIEKSTDPFWLVKAVYLVMFGSSEVMSIDMNGTPAAFRRDLNTIEVMLEDDYEAVINHGTAEHIFNIANVFIAMHGYCAVGGLMIHESPFTGWIDHGFYTIQPTLYYDLAAANDYDIRFMAVNHIEQQLSAEIHSREHLLTMAQNGGIPNNSMLYVAMRKTKDEPFRIPQQGIYSDGVSDEARKAWEEMR